MTKDRQQHPEKICRTCGRSFTWRARWRDNWHEVAYCSKRCRSNKPGKLDQQLEATIAELLAERKRGATICPSEAARRVAPDDWRDLMERTRAAARRLVARGELEIPQRGRPVDPSSARGPIRLRSAT